MNDFHDGREPRRKNILLISQRSVSRYGVQMSLLNIVKSAPPRYHFTWYCPGTSDETFAEEFRRLGVTIVTGGLNLFQCSEKELYDTVARDIRRLTREVRFDIVHINTGNAGFQTRVLLLCTACGIRKRIAHSRNNFPTDDARMTMRMKRAIKICFVVLLSTRRVACSQKAADSMFGKFFARDAIILPNKIDVRKFAFSGAIRAAYRKKLHLEGALVLGHVGVINPQKNHAFLIETFREVTLENDSARLLLIGNGILEAEIRQKVAACHLEDRVIFTGITDAVSEYLCAMDLFVFPSLYEGFGNVAIEAQASGLPCLVSTGVPPEVKIRDDLQFMPLELDPRAWAEKLLKIHPNSDTERASAWETVRAAGFDLDQLPACVERIYG